MASLRLSPVGVEQVRDMKKMKGWGNSDLAEASYVCLSTAKRFTRGDSVSAANFKALCRALGLDEWEALVDGAIKDLDDTAKGAVAVSGVFTENNRLQIEAILNILKKLLQDGDVIIHYPEDEDL